MKNKKKAFIFVLLGLFAFWLVTTLLGSNKENNDKKNDDNKDNPIEMGTFILVNDYNEFFKVDKIVNDNIAKSNKGTIENSYYSNKIYHLVYSNNEYYLIIGEKVEYDYATSKMTMLENIAYLINISKRNNKYDIKKIDEYNSYLAGKGISDNVKIETNNNYDSYSSYKIGNEDLINYYIDYFKQLLFLNYQKAYSFLESSYKKKIGSLDDFNTYREKLYNSIDGIYTDYSVTGENGERTYRLVFEDKKEIILKENGIMDFTFKIKNNG